MSEVKLFQFPSFEEWQRRKFKWSGKIGAFYCEIRSTCWGNDKTWYGCAISTYSNPLNIYVDPVVRCNFEWNHENLSDLKAWYEEVTHKVNEKWSAYIREKYLEESGGVLDRFGKLVRDIRITRSLLLYDMAKALDISPAELSAIECGRKPIPNWFIPKLEQTYNIGKTCANTLRFLANERG